MSTITVTSAMPKLNILKAFALRLGNTDATSKISKLMERSASAHVKSAGFKASGWAKSPLGVGIISGFISDERVLRSVINCAAVALRITGDVAKWAATLPVRLADKAVEVVTSVIARVNEKAAIAFDFVAKVPVQIGFWAIKAASSVISRIYRRVEFSATSPNVINTTARTAFIVSAVQTLKHVPGLRVVGAPVVHTLTKLPFVGKLFASAAKSGWAPLALIGTIFALMAVTDMIIRFDTKNFYKKEISINANPIAEQTPEVAPEEVIAVEPVRLGHMVQNDKELVYVTADGNAYTEEEAIAISRKVMAANRRRRQRPSAAKAKQE